MVPLEKNANNMHKDKDESGIARKDMVQIALNSMQTQMAGG